MAIEAATSTTSISSSTPMNSTSSAQKTSSDNSFRDEMSKVSETSKKEDNKTEKADETAKKADENKKAEDKKESDSVKKDEIKSTKKDDKNSEISAKEVSMNQINQLLTNNITQMIEANSEINDLQSKFYCEISFDSDSKSSFKMNQYDCEFFANLAKNSSKEITVDAINSQIQSTINSGADQEQTVKSAKVSQALLDALSSAREKNQPVRIDFDTNISVILRVNPQGVISAHFIPGDKAVEQYLRNNIELLKNSFNENDLPYTDLSYSHSSKDQNQKRRNQQGDE